ncbi:MAG: hypothetical protein QOJ76_1251, partial [Acidobacteriota bacterium]|nr:hypothetical protein [Acidobacteriota bacterium]
MLHVARRFPALSLLPLLFVALTVCAPQAARAQDGADKAKEEPPFHEYKGVYIGMTADETRKKLGNPTDKDDKQEVYSVNNNETCQVYYDDTKKVFAVSVTY